MTTPSDISQDAIERLELPISFLDIFSCEDLLPLRAALLLRARGRTLGEQTRLVSAADYVEQAYTMWAELPEERYHSELVRLDVLQIVSLVLEDAAELGMTTLLTSPEDEDHVPPDNSLLIHAWLRQLALHRVTEPAADKDH